MAVHAGKDGTVKLSTNVIAEVREWQLDVTGDVVDSTSINSATANSDWRSNVATLKMWEGSLSCYWDETDTNGQLAMDAGATVALKLYPEGDGTGAIFYEGSAIITGISRKAALEGLVEASFSFKGTGALTESTVGS